jgi:hypothetical protein
MTHEEEPLEYPPEIAALLADARPIEGPSAAVKSAVRARVMLTVSAGPALAESPSSAAGAKSAAGAFSVKGVLGAVMATGLAVALVWFALAKPGASTAARTVASEPRPVAAQQTPVAAPSRPITAAPAVVTAPTVSVATPTPTPTVAMAQGASDAGVAVRASEPRETLAEEQRLIERAQRALRADDAGGALRALGAHQQRFARGQLAMEREALRVRALVASGRAGEARSAADRFASRWPDSPLRAFVEGALR